MSLSAQVAGLFYPAEGEILQQMLEGFLKTAQPGEPGPSKIRALIVPHAGYLYSGQTAAKAYWEIQNTHYDRVILIGPMHRFYCSNISIYARGLFSTPLGNVEIDEEFSEQLIKAHKEFRCIPEAYVQEHSIEIQLPFLQMILKEPWKLVPILVGDVNSGVLDDLANSIMSLLSGDLGSTLVIASTDFSHFNSVEEAAVLDSKGKEYILRGNAKRLLEANHSGETELCGILPVYTLLKLFPGARVKFLDYSHSGRVTADQNRVVGYMSLKVEA